MSQEESGGSGRARGMVNLKSEPFCIQRLLITTATGQTCHYHQELQSWIRNKVNLDGCRCRLLWLMLSEEKSSTQSRSPCDRACSMELALGPPFLACVLTFLMVVFLILPFAMALGQGAGGSGSMWS